VSTLNQKNYETKSRLLEELGSEIWTSQKQTFLM
jgi:hypothetical protein